MVRYLIPVNVTGTRITVGMPTTEPTDESRNVFAVAFETDEAWEGLTLTAIFEADKSSAGYLMASDNIAPIPPSVLSAKCKFFSVGLRGTDGDGNVLSSQMANVYPIKRGAPLYDGSEDVDPTLYDQFAAKINDIQNIAEDAKESAAAAVKSVNGQPPDENGNVTVEGGGGGAGTPGGYYTPTVTQPDENTMRVSYAASQDGMTDVPDVDVTLPQGPQGGIGPQGPQGIQGEAGPAGADGAQGPAGADGKSAYQYAQDGGYTGTEEE